MASTVEVERLLHGASWVVRDVAAVLALSTYHVYDQQGVPENENPYAGIVDWKVDGLRVSGPAKRLRRNTLPLANNYADPYARIAIVARALRHEPDWRIRWQQVAPLAFIQWFLCDVDLTDESLREISRLLDSNEPVGVIADRIAGLAADIPDTPSYLV